MIHPTAIVHASVGEDVWIGPYVVIGQPAELRGEWRGKGEVTIGYGTVIREHAVIQGPAVVGDWCYLMHGVHIAHDNKIGDRVTMAPNVALAGHVTVGDEATLGLGTVVHQRVQIGPRAMVGMGSVVTRDVPEGRLWYGNPARDHGPNPRFVE